MEPAGLVEFAVVGQIAFGHESQQGAPVHDGGAVVEPGLHGHGHARHEDEVEVRGPAQDFGQGLFGLLQQQRLPEEVAAGVARDREFGKDRQCGAAPAGLLGQGRDAQGVGPAVGHLHAGNGRGRPEEAQAGGCHRRAHSCARLIRVCMARCMVSSEQYSYLPWKFMPPVKRLGQGSPM